MNKRRFGFTLIELIIVIVIIGILAVVAIPKYFANIKKADKAKILSNLGSIRQAMMGYNAANGSLPSVTGSASAQIIVTIDGDAVLTAAVPAGYSTTPTTITAATTVTPSACSYTMNVSSGAVTNVTGGTCP